MYYQVLDSDGDEQLADNGVEFYWGLNGDASSHLVLEQNDNTLVIWEDARYGFIGSRAFMQILTPEGNSLFPFNGTSFTEDLETENANQSGIAATDYHNGGAVAVWEQEGDIFPRVRVQAMDDEGNRLWGPDGIAVSSTTRSQVQPYISRIGNEYYVTWANSVHWSGFTYNFGIYIQKIVDGALQWGDEGIQFIANSSSEYFPNQIIGDYILYNDNFDVYVTRIDSDGNTATGWPEGGITLCNLDNIQKDPKGVLTDDGLLTIWEDHRDTTRGGLWTACHARWPGNVGRKRQGDCTLR